MCTFSPSGRSDGYTCLFLSGGEFVYFCVLWHRCPIDGGSVWGIPPGGSPPLSFPARLPLLSAAVSLRTAPPSSNPWKFGTNELTAELPPRSLVPNYTVLHTRFILQMARLRSPAGGGAPLPLKCESGRMLFSVPL